ncbi:MAG: patatin-like phospholipase family protein [Chloroflexi bacterium]|nr:patatin-like phospholipase family protein [Chloroflexota bacterium]
MDISLALGGGGSKGNSHIGVLRVLEKEGFRIRAITGTSFGGMVAIFYAAGFSPDEIEEIFAAVDQSRLYDRVGDENPSFLGLGGVYKWLEHTIGERTFADLKIPCVVTAVDLLTSCEVILNSGLLRDAILSTIAVPGIFPAFHVNGWELVDGGVLNPVPVALARSLAPSLPVVAVPLSTPLGAPARSLSMPLPSVLPAPLVSRLASLRISKAFDIFMRSIDIGNRQITELRFQLERPDVIIRPDMADIGLLDRVDVHEVAKRGEAAAEAALPELKRVTAWPNRLRRTLFREVR